MILDSDEIQMDKLDFEYHVQELAVLSGVENLEANRYFVHQAQHIHSLVVQDALMDAFLAAVDISSALSNAEANYFMKYGVGRRLKMMWVSYREILALTPNDRKEPLSHDDVDKVSRDLNAIYINILGVLDNYAWCLLYEMATDQTKKLHQTQVGLFSPKFRKDANLTPLCPVLDEFGDWHKELKTRRDPVAHRIPLSVPPSVLNPEELEQYKELQRQINEATKELNFDRVDELNDQQSRIGTFMSCFVHHPDEEPTPLYPTVPQDIANLIKIAKHVHTLLN